MSLSTPLDGAAVERVRDALGGNGEAPPAEEAPSSGARPPRRWRASTRTLALLFGTKGPARAQAR